jgi:hypothetical protein
MLSKRLLIPVLAAVVAVVAIQLIPVDRSNPPVEMEVAAPTEVRAILAQACYDCHSNRTVWPWYSRIAPISWLVAADVSEARGKLNFSTWNHYSGDTQRWLRGEVWEEVSAGTMPPLRYRLAHRSAILSDQDRRTLRTWADSNAPPAL